MSARRRPRRADITVRAGFAALALLLAVSACGGGDEKADPKPSRTTASASATPTTPPQPKGAGGVTIEIQNWDAYADDPAVLAWKQAVEAFSASSNSRKIAPGMRAAYSESIFRRYVRNLKDYVWKNDWHVTSRVPAKVRRARLNGSTANLVTCLWAPANALRKESGALVVKTAKVWSREDVELTLIDGRWVITKDTFKGHCPGQAPR